MGDRPTDAIAAIIKAVAIGFMVYAPSIHNERGCRK
jgi:hypothetical protein